MATTHKFPPAQSHFSIPHHYTKMQSTGAGAGSLIKCPRCASVNTKFCYYNNYNLSQPRFLCKGCRRYWTVGGVIRNVPVGGGCRKTKRKKQRSGNGKPSSVTVATTITTRERKSTTSLNSGDVAANSLPELKPLITPTESVLTSSFNQTPEPQILKQFSTAGLFSEIGGSFGSLMTSSSDELSTTGLFSEMGGLVVDKTSDVVEYEYSVLSNGGGTAEDWGLFDESYWLNNNNE